MRRVYAFFFLDPTEDATEQSDVQTVYEHLSNDNNNGAFYNLHQNYPALRVYCTFFSDNFLQRDFNGNMMFNIFHLTNHRTNNDLECWHRGWNMKVKDHRRGFWGIVELIQKENTLSERTISTLQNGLPVARRKSNYLIDRENTMARIRSQYVNRIMTALEYNENMGRFTSS